MLIVHRCLLGLDANWAPRVAGTLVQDRWRSNDAVALEEVEKRLREQIAALRDDELEALIAEAKKNPRHSRR